MRKMSTARSLVGFFVQNDLIHQTAGLRISGGKPWDLNAGDEPL